MRQRRLGTTGRTVGELGLGLRGLAYRPIDRTAARDALAHAIERGVDVIDAWRGPAGPTLVGEVIRELRVRDRAAPIVRIAPRPAAVIDADTLLGRVFAPDHVQAQVEELLRATRLEVLPIAALDGWYAAWHDDERWPELAGRLARLVRTGKVLAWAVAGADGAAPCELARALGEPGIALAIAPYHLFERRVDDELTGAVRERDAGLVLGAALDGGALGGELAPGPAAPFHRDDPRTAAFGDERLAATARRAAALAELVEVVPPAARATEAARATLEAALARRGGAVEVRTLPELAVRFALSSASAAPVLVGARTRAHVDAALAAAARGPVGAATLARLREIVTEGQVVPAPHPLR